MSHSPEPAQAVRETPAASLPAAPAPPPKPPEREVVFLPRPAQWTAGTLLAALLIYLAVQAIARWVESFEPVALPKLQLDLNRASRSQLVQLPGVGPALSERIVAYREAYGEFKNLHELRRVPGIGPVMLEKVRPHVFVAEETKASIEPPLTSRVSLYPPAEPKPIKLVQWTGPPLDINRASSEELQKLPGIGPKLSERIIAFRDSRPFTSIDELRKVSGIGPKTLEKIRPYVAVHNNSAEHHPVK